MAADIQEGAHDAGGIAHDEYRVLAHPGREEIAGPWNLALVTKKKPATCEDVSHFRLVDVRVVEYSPADQAVSDINGVAYVGAHGVSAPGGGTACARRRPARCCR